MKSIKSNISVILLTILFYLSCANTPPTWVTSRPNDSNYWHGVGFSASELPDHKNLAKESAIREISSQIKINISSEMEVVMRDDNGSINNMVSSVMKSRVNLMLPELELVGNHSSKEGSYVYFRLNKKKYYEAMDRLRMNAENTALAYIRDAEKKYGINSFYLIQKAWQEILPFNDEPMIVNYKNETVLLYTLIKQKLEEFNHRLIIKGELENKKIRTLVDRENTLTIFVNDRLSNKPLANVPIKVTLPNGQVTLMSKKNGRIDYKFKGLTLASSFDILFQLDHKKVFKELSLIKEILPMNKNVFSITMHIVPSRVSIKSFEKNLNKPMKRKMLEPVIKKIFNNKLEFVIENPDFYIIIESNTIQKADRVGNNYPYFVYGNAIINFKDSKTNEEFFTYVISDVKGADFGSQMVAGIRSYEKMEVELLSRLEEEF
tara:strand:- start:1312 stop:2613 length:1302 start_codon:yes stop_codon:yes gene_type:complete